MDTTTEKPTLSGGELPEELRTEYLRVRALILAEDDVHAVMGLAKLPEEGRWLYLIQTPFATWPKFVIGSVDGNNERPEVLFRCGSDWSAKDEWTRVCELIQLEELP